MMQERQVMIILPVESKVGFISCRVPSNMQVASMLDMARPYLGGEEALQQLAKDYTIFDWGTLDMIPLDRSVCTLTESGILLVIPRASSSIMRQQAERAKARAKSRFKGEIERYLDSVEFDHMVHTAVNTLQHVNSTESDHIDVPTINLCPKCKSGMLLFKKTDRWALYRCPSGCHLLGKVGKHLKGRDHDDAEKEMDSYANSIMNKSSQQIKESLQSMSSDELETWLQAIMRRNQEQK